MHEIAWSRVEESVLRMILGGIFSPAKYFSIVAKTSGQNAGLTRHYQLAADNRLERIFSTVD